MYFSSIDVMREERGMENGMKFGNECYETARKARNKMSRPSKQHKMTFH